MKSLILLFSVSSVFAQVKYELENVPWNGDWLPTQTDTLVHGEDYLGFPGPLPKFLMALGKDPFHPASQFELRYNVDRNAPRWFGRCQSWSCVAMLYDTPPTVTMNGIRLSSAELRGILSIFYAQPDVVLLGESLTNQGLSALQVHQILFNTIAKGSAVIFDVDISEESWNFPVAEFIIKEGQDGEWTHVSLDIGYVTNMKMKDVPDEDVAIFYQNYTYRYKTSNQSSFQWTGESINDHPQRAWVPGGPTSEGAWLLYANRYISDTDYLKLLELFQQESESTQEIDLFEPNNDSNTKADLADPIILASLHTGDRDVFALNLKAGEEVNLHLTVYDGPNVQFALKNPLGNVIEADPNTFFFPINFQAQMDGDYELIIDKAISDSGTVFYHLTKPESFSSFIVTEHESTKGINMSQEPIDVVNGDLQTIPPRGAIFPEEKNVTSNDSIFWASTGTHPNGTDYKKYAWKKTRKTAYNIPHLAMINGWETYLDLQGAAGQSVSVELRTKNGGDLGNLVIELDGQGRYFGALSPLVPKAKVANSAYAIIDTPEGTLSGFVHYQRDAESDAISIPVEQKEVNGDLFVYDLKHPSRGGTGLSLVNLSGQRNLVRFRLMNRNWKIVDEHAITLQPGEKFIDSIERFMDGVDEGFMLIMLAQFNLDSLVIQNGFDHGKTYGHRIISKHRDELNESYISLEGSWDDTSFLIANVGNPPIYILFEGYSADGTLQGRFNTTLGRPIPGRTMTHVPLTQVLNNGVNVGDLDQITHFRIFSPDPFFLTELKTNSLNRSCSTAHPIPVFANP